MRTRNLVLFAAGILFGLGLAVSGMTDPARVTGFLDVTGNWDSSLIFVMGGAVATLGLGLLAWRKWVGAAGWFGTKLPPRDTDPVDRRLVPGAAIFGVGWGLGGFCPGPAIANLAALRLDALWFVAAMAVGMLLARVLVRADRA
ncbi:MAG: YeeE/YedE family protein [Undibacterium sp.]|nr:YeeE/YedE family protein [Opitutaceae bacterium]